ncbi:DUF6069 family protein [Haloactinomyces albus]|uniref:Lysylphosphatidylglycerol synthetase-like protein (DUF2156 family) n=1 Tax=Haloactinomyces albus TaxID=1352928 RepID=A0AAE3ZBQ2_9ACTN|nr:DUF6069 family protein [Haloactinomyces albus]MDR7301967.1 lysylphosphatidylglycerol synthetase-like protein (DUF2156 family) [Haloactinomyces albus]
MSDTTQAVSVKSIRSPHGTRAAAVVTAVIVPAVIWALAVPVGDLELVVPQSGSPMEITLVPVLLSSAVASLAAWAFLVLLERFTGKAKMIWTIAAVVLLAVSFLPLASPEVSAATRAVLVLMHLAVAAVLILGFLRDDRLRRSG